MSYMIIERNINQLLTLFKSNIMIANTYLNFDGNAEEAFRFYHSILGGEFFIQKMSEIPDFQVPEEEKNRTMHVAIRLNEFQHLMASDCLPSMGHVLRQGNNNYISLTTDSKEQADEFFQGLSEGGNIEMPMEEMFWGDYFGSFTDKFGVNWMITYPLK